MTELFTVVGYKLDEDHMTGTEYVGTITLQFADGTQDEHTIWYDEDGNHYFCWNTGEYDEDDEEIVADGLLEDFTDYVAPTWCAHCGYAEACINCNPGNYVDEEDETPGTHCPVSLTNELDLDEDMNAICRKDDSTVICSDCGQRQALEEFGL